MKDDSRNKNIIVFLVLFVWLSFLVVAFTVILRPTLELGEIVYSSKDQNPINLGIVECDCENLYLFDRTRKNLMVYDSTGDNIANYDFTFSGTVKIVEINEQDRVIVVYYYRIHKYYEVNFEGEIISVRQDEVGYIDDYLEISNSAGDYNIQNNFLWYSIYLNQELLFNKVSLLPIVLMSIVIFFVGMAYSVKQIRKKRKV